MHFVWHCVVYGHTHCSHAMTSKPRLKGQARCGCSSHPNWRNLLQVQQRTLTLEGGFFVRPFRQVPSFLFSSNHSSLFFVGLGPDLKSSSPSEDKLIFMRWCSPLSSRTLVYFQDPGGYNFPRRLSFTGKL